MARKSSQKGRSSRQQVKPNVIWDPVVKPDPEALRKAFAMMFRKRPSEPKSEESGTAGAEA